MRNAYHEAILNNMLNNKGIVPDNCVYMDKFLRDDKLKMVYTLTVKAIHEDVPTICDIGLTNSHCDICKKTEYATKLTKILKDRIQEMEATDS